jgi:soluble lytic murein transglycosylase-like protein
VLKFGILKRGLLLLLGLALLPAVADAEIAVLTNGLTLKVSSYRFDARTVTLFLKGGGEATVPSSLIQGIVADEIVEEVAAAVAAESNGDPKDVRRLATETARRHGLDPDLVLAVIAVESAFRPDAVSPKGAQGLMQLMPATARELGVKDPLDPASNLDGGTRYLTSLIRLYDGDLKRALAAYNAGAGAVKRHGGVPPFRETREYVQKVLERYKPAR